MTGASRAAKAAPDGYVFLLAGSATLALIPTLYKKPLYDAVSETTCPRCFIKPSLQANDW